MDIKDQLAEYYSTYEDMPQPHSYELFIIDTINQHRPKYQSVFEFGCNVGKNISILKKLMPEGCDVWGMDYSIRAINKAKEKGLHAVLCNESCLKRLETNSIDVIFTASVLSHIPNVEQILHHFIRVAKKRIILAETNEPKGLFYFPHDYEGFGLTKIVTVPNRFNVKYDIWEYSFE